MNTHQHIFHPLNIPTHEGQMIFVVLRVLIQGECELPIGRGDARTRKALHGGDLHRKSYRLPNSGWGFVHPNCQEQQGLGRDKLETGTTGSETDRKWPYRYRFIFAIEFAITEVNCRTSLLMNNGRMKSPDLPAGAFENFGANVLGRTAVENAEM
jgi:hypothetical protein